MPSDIEQGNKELNAEASRSSDRFGETGKKSMRGSELPPADAHTQNIRYEIYKIVNMEDPNEQARVWREFSSSLKGKDREFVWSNLSVGSDHVTFIDPVDGTRHDIANVISDD